VEGNRLRDNPKHHYPVSGDIMKKDDGDATPEKPSGSIVLRLGHEKKERQTRAQAAKARSKGVNANARGSGSIFDRLMEMSTVTMTMQQQQMQNSIATTMGTPSVTLFRPPQAIPVPSSPVRSVEDSVEVLERFFEWYIYPV
jgi:hypothetical protein